ncbi:MAG TPA: hypothetical protein QGF58_13100 [Myxococcota bacterium]|nr:hypothetical protein [Myxococcota bacterium]
MIDKLLGAATAVLVVLIGVSLTSRPTPRAPRAAADLAAVIDADRDGVDAADYERVSDGIVPFELVDLDGSGELEAWELDVLLRTQSPLVPQPNRLPQVY